MTAQENKGLAAYKDLIEKMVDACRENGGGPRLENHNIISAPLDEDVTPYREFVDTLNESQRKIFITLLRKERCDAFHDALAQFSWWREYQNIKMAIDDQDVPNGIEGDMHNDFVGRYLGFEWPEE